MAVFDAGMPGGNQTPGNLFLRSTSPVFYGGAQSPTMESIQMDPNPADDGLQHAVSFEEEGVAFYKQQNYNIIGPRSPDKPNGKPRPASPASPPLLFKLRSVSEAVDDDLNSFVAHPPTLVVSRRSDPSTPQVPRKDAGISHELMGQLAESANRLIDSIESDLVLLNTPSRPHRSPSPFTPNPPQRLKSTPRGMSTSPPRASPSPPRTSPHSRPRQGVRWIDPSDVDHHAAHALHPAVESVIRGLQREARALEEKVAELQKSNTDNSRKLVQQVAHNAELRHQLERTAASRWPLYSIPAGEGNDDGGTGEAGDSGAVGSIVDLLRGQMREAVDANMAAEREILALRAEVATWGVRCARLEELLEMKEDPATARAADDQQSTMGAKLVDMAVQLEHAQRKADEYSTALRYWKNQAKSTKSGVEEAKGEWERQAEERWRAKTEQIEEKMQAELDRLEKENATQLQDLHANQAEQIAAWGARLEASLSRPQGGTSQQAAANHQATIARESRRLIEESSREAASERNLASLRLSEARVRVANDSLIRELVATRGELDAAKARLAEARNLQSMGVVGPAGGGREGGGGTLDYHQAVARDGNDLLEPAWSAPPPPQSSRRHSAHAGAETSALSRDDGLSSSGRRALHLTDRDCDLDTSAEMRGSPGKVLGRAVLVAGGGGATAPRTPSRLLFVDDYSEPPQPVTPPEGVEGAKQQHGGGASSGERAQQQQLGGDDGDPRTPRGGVGEYQAAHSDTGASFRSPSRVSNRGTPIASTGRRTPRTLEEINSDRANRRSRNAGSTPSRNGSPPSRSGDDSGHGGGSSMRMSPAASDPRSPQDHKISRSPPEQEAGGGDVQGRSWVLQQLEEGSRMFVGGLM